MIKIFIGVILTSYSLVFWIMDLNLLTIDKNILEYLLYCLTHLETLIFRTIPTKRYNHKKAIKVFLIYQIFYIIKLVIK